MTDLTQYASPVGTIYLAAEDGALTGLWIEGQKYFAATLDQGQTQQRESAPLLAAKQWLDAYFQKAPLPPLPALAPKGSAFRQEVWKLLLEIPYGKTTTYGALAQTLRSRGISAAAQAVGGAVGHNPISIIIPCHRVVGSGGSLTGYAGGIAAKLRLLEHEGVELSRLSVPKRGTAL